MHPFLRNTDDLSLMRSSVLAMESHAAQRPYIDPYDLAFESFFSTVSNRFQLGGNNRTSWTVPVLPADLNIALNKIGYSKLRVYPTVVPPGFHGNLAKLLTLMEHIVPTLLVLPNELLTLKAVVAAALNGNELVNNQSGIHQLRTVKGIDPTVLTEYKSYFKPNVVTEALFGQVYANVGEFTSKYNRMVGLAKRLAAVDFVQITKLTESFHDLIQDFHTASKQGILNKQMSTTAIHELSKVTECLATAVTLSAVIQGTMTELVESSKQELVNLDRIVSEVSTEAFGWFGNKETKVSTRQPDRFFLTMTDKRSRLRDIMSKGSVTVTLTPKLAAFTRDSGKDLSVSELVSRMVADFKHAKQLSAKYKSTTDAYIKSAEVATKELERQTDDMDGDVARALSKVTKSTVSTFSEPDYNWLGLGKFKMVDKGHFTTQVPVKLASERKLTFTSAEIVALVEACYDYVGQGKVDKYGDVHLNENLVQVDDYPLRSYFEAGYEDQVGELDYEVVEQRAMIPSNISHLYKIVELLTK